jgi:hypothetical protein
MRLRPEEEDESGLSDPYWRLPVVSEATFRNVEGRAELARPVIILKAGYARGRILHRPMYGVATFW